MFLMIENIISIKKYSVTINLMTLYTDTINLMYRRISHFR
jgi:hypothetical protein